MSLASRLKNIKVSRALIFVSAAPLSIALLLTIWGVIEYTHTANDMGRLQKLVNPIALLSDLVHEQQKERGVTAVFIGSEGKKFRKELTAQRIETDAKTDLLLAQLAENDLAQLNADLGDKMKGVLELIARRGEIRKRVDSASIQGEEAIRHYTTVNGEILDLIQSVSRLSSDSVITSGITAFTGFLMAKEQVGIERAIGSRGYANGQFTSEELADLYALITVQDAYFGIFTGNATETHVKQLNEFMLLPVVRKVENMRELAFSNGHDGDISAYSGVDFFEAQTGKINALKDLENLLSRDLSALMASEFQNAKSQRNIIILIMIVALLIACSVTFFLIRTIRSNFGTVLASASEMAAGNLEVALPSATNNELGQIVVALTQLRESILEGKKTEQEMREAELREQERQRDVERAETEAGVKRAAERDAIAAEIRAYEQAAAQEISVVVAACAQGDFSQQLETANKKGVFADICEGVNQVCEVANHGLGEIQISLEELSRGNLTHRMDGEFLGVFDEIRNTVNTTAESLAKSISQIDQSSTLIGASTTEVAEAAGSLATRTEQAAATLEQTAAAIQVLSGLVSSTASLSATANTEAASIQEMAENGDEIVASTVEAMHAIRSSTTAIGKTITLIDDITFQTNLLALNAGVEAARAGEAGRGFAVVASEVRDLAARSSDAAREISTLIATSEEQVNRGVSMVDQTGAALKSISAGVTGIASQIAEISNSAEEQSNSIDEINLAAKQLDQTTQQNAAMFEETTATSIALQEETNTLAHVISAFDIGQGRLQEDAVVSSGETPLGRIRNAENKAAAANAVQPKTVSQMRPATNLAVDNENNTDLEGWDEM